MLSTSPVLVIQSSKNLAENEFGKSDCGKDKTRILLASFASKDLTGAEYLISGAKKAFNLLRHVFIQAFIF